jgi:hypothetical protein
MAAVLDTRVAWLLAALLFSFLRVAAVLAIVARTGWLLGKCSDAVRGVGEDQE